MISGTELDAAVVCTPTHVRKEVVVPLIEAKIPVIVCEENLADGRGRLMGGVHHGSSLDHGFGAARG